VQSTRFERVVEKVSVPQKVMKTVPVTEIRLVPRTVTRRIPIDSNGNPIVVQSLSAPVSSPSDLPAAATPAASPAAGEGTTVTSKKPALIESGDLPAPSAPAAPPVPTEPIPSAESSAGTSSKTELKIGSDTTTEKSGKIRVTGDE
jgi:hypothetical protein